MSRNQQAAQGYQAADAAAAADNDRHSASGHGHSHGGDGDHGHSHGGGRNNGRSNNSNNGSSSNSGSERASLLLDGQPISALGAASSTASSSGSHHHHRSLTSFLPEAPHIFSAFGMWAPAYILAFTLGCFLAAFVIGRPPHCDPELQHFLLATAAVVVVSMAAFMLRDVREQRRRSLDDDSDDSCDWLVWTMRVLFLCALIALALWGKMLLDAEADSAAAEAANPAAVPSDVTPGSDDSVCKEGHDADLVYVCWWIVLIEASIAAVSGGVILAQSIASACDW